MWSYTIKVDWKVYNKLDTKLRENVKGLLWARRKFDKQFKKRTPSYGVRFLEFITIFANYNTSHLHFKIKPVGKLKRGF